MTVKMQIVAHHEEDALCIFWTLSVNEALRIKKYWFGSTQVYIFLQLSILIPVSVHCICRLQVVILSPALLQSVKSHFHGVAKRDKIDSIIASFVIYFLSVSYL